ncbi:MAG: hypothetical protein K0R34_1811 [Herbinix sp.]|jgi:hypothetical protein|nr:hypothetical protein [Herbinix sp.]
MKLEELRRDCAIKQKKGLHFILASVVIWSALLIVQLLPLPILTKNLFTFCCTAPLVPIAYFISKLIKVDFQNKGNPLNGLGVLFSLNQMIYLLIAMWAYQAVPEKMLMIIAMIFGAHLLPYGWLYQSRTYMVLSVVVPILALYLGISYSSYILAGVMILVEIVFSILLIIENKKMASQCVQK